MRVTSLSASAVVLASVFSARCPAGPVTPVSGGVDIRFDAFGSAGEEHSVSFPVNYPESVTRELTQGGQGSVTYDLHDTADGASLTVSVSNHGDDPPGSDGGRSSFGFTFTTDRPMAFHFSAGPEFTGTDPFSATFDDLSATAQYTQFGEFVGTVPVILDEFGNPEDWGRFVRGGRLEPGTHTFTVEAVSGVNRYDDTGRSAGSAVLELSATAVPLPSAARVGLGGLLLVTALCGGWRRSRHA